MGYGRIAKLWSFWVLAWLLWGLLPTVSVSADEPTRLLRVEIPWAVPFSASDQDLGRRPLPLTVDLPLVGDAAAGRAWAWFPAMPEVEHPVTLKALTRHDDGRIDLALHVVFRDAPPRYLGGQADYVLTLTPAGEGFVAEYTGTVKGIDDDAADTPARLWVRMSGPGQPDWKGKLNTGSVRSYAHVVTEGWGNSNNTPIMARATWVDASASDVDAPPLLPADLTAGGEPVPSDAIAVEALRAEPPLAVAQKLARFALAARARSAAGQALSEADRTALRSAARWLCATEPTQRIPDSPWMPGRALADVRGAHDHQLAAVRAAAGIALIVAGSELESEPGLDVVRRSLTRWLDAAIGDQGASTGQANFAQTVELVRLCMDAWHHRFDQPMADDAPLDRALIWVRAATPPGSPLPPALGHAAARQPMAAERREQRVWLDTAMGQWIARTGYDTPEAVIATMHLGTHPREAHPMRGQVSLYSHGRYWLEPGHREPDAPAFGWPGVQGLNVPQVEAALRVPQGPAEPSGPGSVARVRAGRDGSFSLAMQAGGFVKTQRDKLDEERELEDSKAWRTFAVDTSGRYGADTVVVLVDTHVGLEQRQRLWQLHLGDLPSEAVKVQGTSFTISPPGAGATLNGRVLFPASVGLRYEPADRKAGRATGRLVMDVPRMGRSREGMLSRSMDLGAAAGGEVEVEALPDDLALPLDDERKPSASHEADARRVGTMLFRHMSSTKMGGGDRRPRAEGCIVVVMTIQRDKPPAVKVVAGESDTLCTIGGQPVGWEEWLVRFPGSTAPSSR